MRKAYFRMNLIKNKKNLLTANEKAVGTGKMISGSRTRQAVFCSAPLPEKREAAREILPKANPLSAD